MYFEDIIGIRRTVCSYASNGLAFMEFIKHVYRVFCFKPIGATPKDVPFVKILC